MAVSLNDTSLLKTGAYINGQWVASDSGDTLDVTNPATGEVIAERTTAEWLEVLDSHGVPCAPVLDTAGVVADPHVAARGTFMPAVDPVVGVEVVDEALELAGHRARRRSEG